MFNNLKAIKLLFAVLLFHYFTANAQTVTLVGNMALGAANKISDGSNINMKGGRFRTGSGAGYSETVGTLTLSANSTIDLGTGSHNLNFAASNGQTWTGGAQLRIQGWQGAYNCTSGTSGKIYTGSSAELSASKLAQIFFIHPTSGLGYTACQLGDGEIVPTSTLPIELITFEAKENNDQRKVQLTWITASEINNDYFVIERSLDGINWLPADTIDGAGNSNAFLTYVHLDDNPYSGTSYYRLKQVDFDGSTSYSNIEVVNFEGLEITSLFPNPSKGEVSISLKSSSAGALELKVYDVLGKLVSNEVFMVNEGMSNINTQINAADGKYFVSVMMSNGEYYDYDVIVIEK